MLNYSIGRVWILLEEAEPVVPWKYLFPGSPHYYTVYKYLLSQGLREKLPELAYQLEEQKNYAELRR